MDMPESRSFHSDKKFYGEPYFPYGIARSGEFTLRQVTLLETHGKAYEALHKGLQAPINKEEERFVEVCQGKCTPETDHEKVWSLFCKKIGNQTIISAFGNHPGNDAHLVEAGDSPFDDD